MSKATRITSALLLIAALATTAFAADAYSIKRVAKVGDTLKFKLVVDADFGGTKLNLTGTVNEKVVKVAENGDITTESSQSDTVIKFGDQEMPMNDDSVQTTITNKQGLILEIKGDMVDSNQYRLGNMSAIKIPEADIKVGEKWSHEYKADSKTGAVAGKAEYEVLAAEKVLGHDTVKIKWTYKEAEGAEPASAEGTAWISTKDGSTVKVTASYKAAPLPGAPAPVDMTVTLERQ